jgi:hypothetical protein
MDYVEAFARVPNTTSATFAQYTFKELVKLLERTRDKRKRVRMLEFIKHGNIVEYGDLKIKFAERLLREENAILSTLTTDYGTLSRRLRSCGLTQKEQIMLHGLNRKILKLHILMGEDQ